ncbi:hypothetical protein cypCar_00043184, partial [Cyprinus carpio]
YSGNVHDHTFIITFFTTCFILPLGVIIVCYCKLLRKLRKVSNSHGRLGNARKPERQVTRMVVVMIVAFMVAWTPYAAFSIVVTALPSIHLDPRLAAFRKCVVQLLSCSDVTVIEGNINQTTERAGMTNESNTGEMSAIAGTVRSKTDERPNERNSCPQIPIPENKVCPM